MKKLFFEKEENKKYGRFNDFYNQWKLQSIIQGIGRGVRNMNDYCFVLLCDCRYTKIMKKYKDKYLIRSYHPNKLNYFMAKEGLPLKSKPRDDFPT